MQERAGPLGSASVGDGGAIERETRQAAFYASIEASNAWVRRKVVFTPQVSASWRLHKDSYFSRFSPRRNMRVRLHWSRGEFDAFLPRLKIR